MAPTEGFDPIDTQIEPHIKGFEEAVRSHGPRRVWVGGAELTFRPAMRDDPVPTGLQILELVDACPSEECMCLSSRAAYRWKNCANRGD